VQRSPVANTQSVTFSPGEPLDVCSLRKRSAATASNFDRIRLAMFLGNRLSAFSASASISIRYTERSYQSEPNATTRRCRSSLVDALTSEPVGEVMFAVPGGRAHR
jgi:hypothetical protein